MNGDAEADPQGLVATGWMRSSGSPSIHNYASDGFPAFNDPGPSARGTNLFYGGYVASSSLRQSLTVGALSEQVDGGFATYVFSGWLGGYFNHRDRALAAVTFLDEATNYLGAAQIGPVTVSDRAQVTGLFYREASGTVPPRTRQIRVDVTFVREDGSCNDGYADNLTLTLQSDDPELRIVRLDSDGFRRVIEWQSRLSNAVYLVETCTNLLTADWETAQPTSQWWIAHSVWTNEAALDAQRFYRIRAKAR